MIDFQANSQNIPVGESHHKVTAPDSVVAQVIRQRARGATYRELVGEFNVCKSTIVQWCNGRCRNIAPLPAVAATAEDYQHIRELRASGMSRGAIAQHLKVTESSVQTALLDMGIASRIKKT